MTSLETTLKYVRDAMHETIIDVMHAHALDDDENVYPLQKHVRNLKMNWMEAESQRLVAEQREGEAMQRIKELEEITVNCCKPAMAALASAEKVVEAVKVQVKCDLYHCSGFFNQHGIEEDEPCSDCSSLVSALAAHDKLTGGSDGR